jgi:UDP-glucose 4-epimerase
MRVLVTGSTGVLGRAIVARLTHAGHQVVGAARGSRPGHPSAGLDVCSSVSCDDLFSGAQPFDAVVHCAGVTHVKEAPLAYQQYHRTNAEGTRNILAAAAAHGVPRFVQVSTVAVYGVCDLPQPVSETSPTKPFGHYSVSKRIAEDFCLERQGELSLYILRMAPMYGADSLANLRGKVTAPLLGRHCYLTLAGDTARFSLCSSRNGAAAVLWALEGRLEPGTYNVADDCHYNRRHIIAALEKLEGKRRRVTIPRGAASLALKVSMWCSVTSRRRLHAYSRYRHLLEDNLYSIDKLTSAGFDAEPDLLNAAKA